MKTIAFIPVRCGSKSIPLKNIKLFCGEPLLYWSAKAASETSVIDQVVIATDCDEIASVVQGFKLDKLNIYLRDSANAQDESSTESVILEYLKSQSIPENFNFILIQATCPFIQSYDLEKAFEKYSQHGIDSVLSCVRVKKFFWNDNRQPFNYNHENRPRRQDFKGTLWENGAFYINSVHNILRTHNRISGKIEIYEMDEYATIDIDEAFEWELAEKIMYKNNLARNSKLSKIKLFISDVDGVLTDSGMYYSESGEEMKKFNTRDGVGFRLLSERSIKTCIITTEDTRIVERRSKKIQVDFLFQGIQDKLSVANSLCEKLNIDLSEVAFIGDDINDLELLKQVGLAACPSDASNKILAIPGIHILMKKGGEGVVREFVDRILQNDI